MATATLEHPMTSNKKTSKGRLEMQADQDWLDRISREAKKLGLSVSAFVRMAVTEYMDGREQQRPQPQPKK